MRVKWLNEYKIQALICPNFHHSAFKIDNAIALSRCLDYQKFWGFFQYPCGSMPIAEVRDDTSDMIYEDKWNDKLTQTI